MEGAPALKAGKVIARLGGKFFGRVLEKRSIPTVGGCIGSFFLTGIGLSISKRRRKKMTLF